MTNGGRKCLAEQEDMEDMVATWSSFSSQVQKRSVIQFKEHPEDHILVCML